MGKPGTGSYFPIKAVQSFNAKDGLIRNGVYLGPVASLFFDGAFVWREKQRMLEFQFDQISFTLVRWPISVCGAHARGDKEQSALEGSHPSSGRR